MQEREYTFDFVNGKSFKNAFDVYGFPFDLPDALVTYYDNEPVINETPVDAYKRANGIYHSALAEIAKLRTQLKVYEDLMDRVLTEKED